MKQSEKIIVIVPAFNEQESIGETIRQIRAVFPELQAQGFETFIHVIDDGSSDGTAAVAVAAGADRVIRHKVNRGLGAAVRTGLTNARADGAHMVVKFDADLQHDPRDIVALVRPLLDDFADIVYGHRFERIEYEMPFVRRMGNRVFAYLMRFLTDWPIKDSQPGIFAVNRAYLEVFRIPGDYNYTQQILLDAFHKGMRFAHEDVRFQTRRAGNSFVTFRYPVKVLPQIFWVIVGVKPMKIFGPIGLAFLLGAFLIGAVEIFQWVQGSSSKPIVHVNAVLGALLFGLQTFFFGVLAELVIQSGRR